MIDRLLIGQGVVVVVAVGCGVVCICGYQDRGTLTFATGCTYPFFSGLFIKGNDQGVGCL